MENLKPSNEINSKDEVGNADSVSDKKEKIDSLGKTEANSEGQKELETTTKKQITSPLPKKSETLGKTEATSPSQNGSCSTPKKTVKPPKLEEKPFKEFISNHLIPELKKSIQGKGTLVIDIKLIEGTRPVVGGNCWMIVCELSEQRRFWLCFNKELITSNKTILLSESNSEPSIVESFLIDEKKTTLPLLISRVLQRLNGQKWIGAN